MIETILAIPAVIVWGLVGLMIAVLIVMIIKTIREC